MMKAYRLAFFALAQFWSLSSFASSQDQGVISDLYSDELGRVAVKLGNGFPNAASTGQCPTNNGWAGVSPTVAATLKATLLLAKQTGATIAVIIDGCEANGQWLRITSAYVK